VTFAKEHLLGIVLGIVLFELYWRSMRPGPKGGQG
jgi:hypothetical protein